MESRCIMIASMSLIRHVTTKAYHVRLLQVYSDGHSGRTYPHTRILAHMNVSCYTHAIETSNPAEFEQIEPTARSYIASK